MARGLLRTQQGGQVLLFLHWGITSSRKTTTITICKTCKHTGSSFKLFCGGGGGGDHNFVWFGLDVITFFSFSLHVHYFYSTLFWLWLRVFLVYLGSNESKRTTTYQLVPILLSFWFVSDAVVTQQIQIPLYNRYPDYLETTEGIH